MVGGWVALKAGRRLEHGLNRLMGAGTPDVLLGACGRLGHSGSVLIECPVSESEFCAAGESLSVEDFVRGCTEVWGPRCTSTGA
jgi:hypothetical protein